MVFMNIINLYHFTLLAPSKDPIARKLRLRRRHVDQAEADTAQAKILKGMKDIAKDKDNRNFNELKQAEPLKPKRYVA